MILINLKDAMGSQMCIEPRKCGSPDRLQCSNMLLNNCASREKIPLDIFKNSDTFLNKQTLRQKQKKKIKSLKKRLKRLESQVQNAS